MEKTDRILGLLGLYAGGSMLRFICDIKDTSATSGSRGKIPERFRPPQITLNKYASVLILLYALKKNIKK